MSELKRRLEAIWNDKQVRNALKRTHWVIKDSTGLPGIKKINRKAKSIYNRLTKEFSWRK